MSEDDFDRGPIRPYSIPERPICGGSFGKDIGYGWSVRVPLSHRRKHPRPSRNRQIGFRLILDDTSHSMEALLKEMA